MLFCSKQTNCYRFEVKYKFGLRTCILFVSLSSMFLLRTKREVEAARRRHQNQNKSVGGQHSSKNRASWTVVNLYSQEHKYIWYQAFPVWLKLKHFIYWGIHGEVLVYCYNNDVDVTSRVSYMTNKWKSKQNIFIEHILFLHVWRTMICTMMNG